MAKRSVWFQIRRGLGAHTSCPVRIVPGDSPPTLEGKPGHWSNGWRLGPHSWRRRRRPEYHPSTLMISVGKEWLERERPEILGRVLTERMVNPAAYQTELRRLK